MAFVGRFMDISVYVQYVQYISILTTNIKTAEFILWNILLTICEYKT